MSDANSPFDFIKEFPSIIIVISLIALTTSLIFYSFDDIKYTINHTQDTMNHISDISFDKAVNETDKLHEDVEVMKPNPPSYDEYKNNT